MISLIDFLAYLMMKTKQQVCTLLHKEQLMQLDVESKLQA